MDNASKSVVMVAGEASGDRHGAHVIEALRRKDALINVCGAGGPAMRRAGADIVVDIDELSVMGITAVLLKAPQILKAISRLKRLIDLTRPDLLILVDFPDFNLHLAGYAKKRGTTVLYYVSPQLWAWRTKRTLKIKKRVDHMAVILPFEVSIYENYDIPVTYVGHPLLDDIAHRPELKRRRKDIRQPIVGFFPGSREDEVRRLLPHMLEARLLLEQHLDETRFIVSCAPSIDKFTIQSIANEYSLDGIEISSDPVSELFPRCTLAVVASGTASLEAAIYGTPAIVVYKMSAFTYWVAKKMVKVPHIAMANLIAGRTVFPELVQDAATGENIAERATDLLKNPSTYQNMIEGIRLVQRRLGDAGAAVRVADIAYRLMEGGRAV